MKRNYRAEDRHRPTIKAFAEVLWWGVSLWRSLLSERCVLTERALRLEAALHQAQCERDDWMQIAQAVAVAERSATAVRQGSAG